MATHGNIWPHKVMARYVDYARCYSYQGEGVDLFVLGCFCITPPHMVVPWMTASFDMFHIFLFTYLTYIGCDVLMKIIPTGCYSQVVNYG